jgi:Fe-S oxidoreductase/nitrate reductase gamma subunit
VELTRQIYWNIVYGGWIYLFFAISAAVFLYAIQRRVRLWRLAGKADRFDRLGERLRGLVSEVLGQRRLLRDPFAGVSHLLIFYGFGGLTVATALIALQEWTGIHFLQGTFYLWYSLLSDTAGILGLVGLGMAFWRRGVRRPATLHTSVDDWVALWLLLILFLQGFAVQGIRIAVTVLQQEPWLAHWSPAGYAVALLLQDVNPDTLRAVHRSLWWIHALTAFAFIGYLGFGKLAHIVYGLLGSFFRDLAPSGRLTHPDIEAALETDPDSLDSLGVDKIEQLSWKNLLDLDSCTNCGRCEAVCPAHGSGVPLGPRKLIRDMKRHLAASATGLLGAGTSGNTGDAGAPAVGPLLGERGGEGSPAAVGEDELWGCRTCGACQRECPVYIEHVPKIVDMRRYLVMTEAKMSEEVQQFLKNLDDRMHPWVGAGHDREAWFADLDLKVLGRGDTAEYLFWVGCTGAMVDRNIEVTRAVARVLKAARVDFAVLGAEEACSGDPARRVGGELTFQTCAKTNIETFERYGVRKIIATCPHCFNTLRNEYPDFDGHYEVTHHTQLIAELIRNGRLNLRRKLDLPTYHDPCYLGRHNGEYDAPREILSSLSASGGIRELDRSRSRSLCCGAGGGYAWMDDDPQQRINHTRVEQVKASGADTVALGCPFCMQMFEDGLAARDPQKSVRAADLAELVAGALDG